MSKLDQKKVRAYIRNQTLVQEAKKIERIGKMKGSNPHQINEFVSGIADSIMGSEAVQSTVKKYLIEMTMDYLGMNQSEHGVMYSLIENVFEAVDYTQITKYFGDNNCDELMKVVTEGILETVTELGSAKLLSYLASSFMPDMPVGDMSNSIFNALNTVSQESLNEVVVGLIQGYLQEPLRDIICNGKLSNALSGVSGLGMGSLMGAGDGNNNMNLDSLTGLLDSGDNEFSVGDLASLGLF